jgi:hypothetical protein
MSKTWIALAAVCLAAGSAAAASPKKNYIVKGFVEETGSDLGYGNYEEDSTASSGKQCRATFSVSEGKKFSLTQVTAKGPNGKPAAVLVRDPDGKGSARAASAQTSGRGWEAVSHASDGDKNHDGTWTVVLPPAKGAMGRTGCSAHNNAVRVVFEVP